MEDKLTQQRDIFWDTVKGVAILLVVLGHSIQYGSGQDYLWQSGYFDNKLFQFICSFHMPLFMLVSGYFFNGTLGRRSLIEIFKLKLSGLLIPIFCFSVIRIIVMSLGEGTILQGLKQFPYYLINTLWFLWALLGCVLINLAIEKWIPDWKSYLLVMLALLFCPNKFNLSYLAYLFPYFVCGMYAGKYGLDKKADNMAMCGTSFVLFVILFLFYSKDDFVYTTGTCIINPFSWHQLLMDIYRWAIGLCGSVFMICVLKKLASKGIKTLAWFGVLSMGIYCWQDTVSRLCFHLFRSYAEPNILWYLVSFCFMLAVSVALTVVTRKIPMVYRFLYGGR